ncbi:hypothetical protein Tco_0788226, partial [Tanacetum coccineum]
LKKQFETFLYHQPPVDSFEYSTDYCRDVSIYLVFREYTYNNDVESFQSLILYYLNGIDNRINARAHLEKELLLKERDVKQGWEHEKRFEMQKQDTIIQESKCIISRENTNAGDGKISKDASEIDNNVTRDFHDKDNITEVQSSNNETIENVFAHDHDQKHATEKTKTDNKTLKEENVLLNKEIETFMERILVLLVKLFACHPKLYDAEVLGLHYMQPNVHDTEEILNDAEEKLLLEQEYLTDPSTSNVSFESSSEESDVPPKEMPNESKLLKLFSYVEIKNIEEIKRFSKESKDGDKFCNDVVEVKEKLTQLENLKGKSVETKFDKPSILEKPPADRLLITSQLLKSWFTPKVVVQKDLSKSVTTQSLSKNEKDQLLSRIASLKSKLASQDLRSCQKEYHDLRTSYNALKIKFDSINQTKRKTKVSNSLKSKVSVSEKVHTGESSKPFLKRVSHFTTYSLQKDRKFSKKSKSFKTPTPQKVFKTSVSNAKNELFETSLSHSTPVKQVWRFSKKS